MIMLPRIPKCLCNQSIVLHIANGEEDDYGKPIVKKQQIDNVIVQPQTIYAGNSNGRQVTANAVVFILGQISTPMPALGPDCVGWHLQFEGRNYTITRFVDNREPFSNDVYSYELEVL